MPVSRPLDFSAQNFHSDMREVVVYFKLFLGTTEREPNSLGRVDIKANKQMLQKSFLRFITRGWELASVDLWYHQHTERDTVLKRFQEGDTTLVTMYTESRLHVIMTDQGAICDKV